MSKQISNFFQGSLFVSESYLDALIPHYFKSITSGLVSVDKTVKELETAFVSYADQSSSDVNLVDDSGKVVVIDFIGPVVKYYDWWDGMLGTQEYMQLLDRFKNDPTVAGVVLKVDSGGGQKYGTPEFYDYINDFKNTKPIVVYTNGLLCSGAYYFAAPSSFIIANKRADAIGSIGIYTELFDWNGYYESFGLKVHTIYSDLSDEKNKAYRDVMSGADKNYKNYITKELNPDGQKFIDDMKGARPILNEAVFKGGVWNGEEALAMGLVDAVGTEQDAINKVYELKKAMTDSNNSSKKTNLKTKTMSKNTKSFPLIQGIIGVTGEGIATISTIAGKKGIQVTEAQLEKIELAISGHEAALTAEKTKVTTAEGKVTGMETAISSALETAKLTAVVDANATNESKIELLGSKVVEYGKRSGAMATTPKADGDQFEEKGSIAIETDDHNEFYNKA